MAAESDKKPAAWHLSREIPISLLWIVVGQFVVIAGLGAKTVWSVEDHERRISATESARADQRLTLLESQMSDVRSALLRMEGKLDRVLLDKQK